MSTLHAGKRWDLHTTPEYCESFEFIANGLRYRVTDRILASRSSLPAGQCADYGRETWSFDLVALGPAAP